MASSSWFSTLECCFPQLNHAQRLAKLKAAEDIIHDDDSSTYSDSDSEDDSDYSQSSCEDDGEADEQEDDELQQQQALLLAMGNRGMRVSDSVKTMLRHQQGPSAVTKNAMMRRGSGSAATAKDEFQQQPQSQPEQSVQPPQNPSETLQRLLTARGVNTAIRSSTDIHGFFFQHEQGHINAYDMDVMSAVRSANLDVLRELHSQGKQLQCCNKFYESIFHAAARRGGADVLLFLIYEANLDLRVCCASGRTPLHDACWTASPDFDAIKVILQVCPDFLLISDNRNFTPLAYVPKDSWAAWSSFLEANQDLLIPKTLV